MDDVHWYIMRIVDRYTMSYVSRVSQQESRRDDTKYSSCVRLQLFPFNIKDI